MPELIKASSGDHNLKDYAVTANNFNWDNVAENFSWSQSGLVNLAYEAVDRHAVGDKADQLALIFDSHLREDRYSFRELATLSNQAANVLHDLANVRVGDQVALYLPRLPELYIYLLGTLKNGAVVNPLYPGYRSRAILDRLSDSGAQVLITTEELLAHVPLKELANLNKVIVIDRELNETNELFISGQGALASAKTEFSIQWLSLEDNILLHYTSGSTGKPKGVLHANRAMLQYYQTAYWVLDLKADDIYWCTADPGWITGTTYGIFAPWLLGCTVLICGDRFNPSYWYQLIDKYKVTVWYSSPTAFRMLMGADPELLQTSQLSSLRHILSVGEPLTPDIVRWSVRHYGLPIHDTWFMTETGAQIICNYPALDIRPGSMGKPLPGIVTGVVDEDGQTLPPYTLGVLAIKKGWPAMLQTIFNNEQEYNNYFVNDWFITGDSVYYDEDGYIWFQGRIDDIINAAGERIGPFEVESRIGEHPAVAEVGVIGKPDPLEGEIIKAFISLKHNYQASEELENEIREYVRSGLSRHAVPKEIEFIAELPKTRSGKIMRRVLTTQELNLPESDLTSFE